MRGVIHCFTGNYEAACAYLDLGFYLSFTGIITFKNAERPARSGAAKCRWIECFVETDSPYLTPVPHRGKRNEPAYVRFVAETIATVKNVDLATVAQATSANVKNLFCI